MSSFLRSPAAGTLGTILVRVVVPLWILAGVVMKLLAASPKLLPKNIWTTAVDVGLTDLYILLAVILGLEIFAIGVMVLLPRLARAMAIFMLVSFCAILIWEIASGNANCGCLGNASPSPWVMLGIDGTMLLLVLLFAPTRREPAPPVLSKGGLGAIAGWTIAGFALSAAVILPQRSVPRDDAVAVIGDGTDPAPPNGGGPVDPAPPAAHRGPGGPRPALYYIDSDIDWTGTAWAEFPMATFMRSWPDGIETGRHQVIFYSRSCDHCQEMLEMYFHTTPPIPTTVVAMPELKTGFDTDQELVMDFCRACVTEMEMPVGTEYMITPPLVVSLEDGMIRCVKEAEETDLPECLNLP